MVVGRGVTKGGGGKNRAKEDPKEEAGIDAG